MTALPAWGSLAPGVVSHEPAPLGAEGAGGRANAVSPVPTQHILLVQRQMSVIAEDVAAFQAALKRYADGAASQRGCLR